MRVWIEIKRLPKILKSNPPFHPLMRVWIEMMLLRWFKRFVSNAFHPLMRVWIEIKITNEVVKVKCVSPSYEGVDWNVGTCWIPSWDDSFTLLWGCGLKYDDIFKYSSDSNLFHPLMRVWIEILPTVAKLLDIAFHPLMRVWIEIIEISDFIKIGAGFTLLWGCGLKFRSFQSWGVITPRFTLLWGCGLKYLDSRGHRNYKCFTLLWGCGLKWTKSYLDTMVTTVSPSYEGVDWNEPTLMRNISTLSFTLLWGCGLKCLRLWLDIGYFRVSPSYEGVDWNKFNFSATYHARVSPSYEGVDWNNAIFWISSKYFSVSPSYEGVDWNWVRDLAWFNAICFTLLWGCGLKLHCIDSGSLN